MIDKIWHICIPIMKKQNTRGYFGLDFCMRILIMLQPALALPVFLNLMLTAYEASKFKLMILYTIIWFLGGVLFLVGRYWFDIVVNGRFFYKTIENVRDICIREIYDKNQNIDSKYDANTYYTYLSKEVEIFTMILFRIDRLVAVLLVTVAFFGWCIHISIGMTFLVLFGGIISVLVGNRASRKLNDINKELFEQKTRLNSALRNIFFGTETYLVKRKYQQIKKKYEENLREYNAQNCKNSRKVSGRSNLISIIDCSIYIVMIILCYFFFAENSAATILTMISAYQTMKGYVNELNSIWMMIVEKSYVVDNYGGLTIKLDECEDEPLTSNDYFIEIRDLCYEVGETQILNNINLFVRQNEKVALIGVNGAGKSTLLKCVLKLIQPTSGEIRFKEQFEYAYIPINPQLFPVSIRENIQYASSNKILNISDIIEAADVVKIDSIDLHGELVDGDENLSGGEAQRVAIARAFAMSDYQIMIADEPTANLDIQTEKKIIREIFSRADTLIYTTHNPSLVNLADEVYIMKCGRIVAYGTPEVVCNLEVYKEWEKNTQGE